VNDFEMVLVVLIITGITSGLHSVYVVFLFQSL